MESYDKKGNTVRKILLIGWDAADWKVIHPLLDSGRMPNLQKMIQNGVMGNLASLRPELSPMLWTSIATGKRPYKHGILGFTEPNPDGRGMRPVTNLSRKSKCIWNILNQSGYRSLVVGWWPSHPAEPINGVMVSNHYQRAVAPYGAPWPMQQGTVHPERLRKNLADLRLHPQEIDPGLMQQFVPNLINIDQEKDKRIEAIAKTIADATTIQRAASALMHHERWDFAAVYFDAIDHFSHGFMDYYPPKSTRVSDVDFENYKSVVENGYILHDFLLGSMMKEIDGETTVILVSDHGFHSDHLRPVHIPGEPAGPAAQHRPYGIFVMSGPGIKKDELIYGSSLLDVCPTILSCCNLPVGEDMDGKVLLNCFREKKTVQFISSWDHVEGDDGSHLPGFVVDPLESSETIRQLVDLGYIDEPDENEEKAASNASRELRYNLAKSYMDAGLHGNAETILQELTAQWPEEYRFGLELVYCCQMTDQAVRAQILLEDILKRKEQQAEIARKELEELHQNLSDSDENCGLQWKMKQRIIGLRQRASINSFGMSYLRGAACQAVGDHEKALEYFRQAEGNNIVSAALLVQEAVSLEALQQIGRAEETYQKALEIDGENCKAMLGLCRLSLDSGNNTRTAHLALDVIALRYYTPQAHFYLGCALHGLGKLSDAVRALGIAVQQNPNFPEAHRCLADIYEKSLHHKEKAAECTLAAREAQRRIEQMQKGEVPVGGAEEPGSHHPQAGGTPRNWGWTQEEVRKSVLIVSGLPRSGTSLIMQMLDAGGFPVLTDHTRCSDSDNPRGYFEYQAVKRLPRENRWLLGHSGVAVKVIAQLLPFLPEVDTVPYRIIFMERNLDEILQSQMRMLENMGRKKKNSPRALIKSGFYKQLEQAKAFLASEDIPVLYVRHQECICQPERVVAEINSFMGGILDVSRMAEVVDERLYRNRIG